MTMRGQASTLSACAHVHTTRRLHGACWEGVLHMRRRQRVGCSPQQCWRSERYGEVNYLEATALGHMQGCACARHTVTSTAVPDLYLYI